MKFFESILNQSTIDQPRIDAKVFFILTGVALLLGIIAAVSYTVKSSEYSRSFIMTVSVLPMVVEIIILLVNSLSTGIAIAGLFNLVRFRSVPGNAKEITNIFMASITGVAVGTGYIGYAVILLVVNVLINLVFSFTSFGASKGSRVKLLRITVPETLDFEGIFDDIFDKFTTSREIERVKTTNMGSLYQISYKIKLKDGVSEKEMIDEIRVRNGNLEIVSTRYETPNNVL